MGRYTGDLGSAQHECQVVVGLAVDYNLDSSLTIEAPRVDTAGPILVRYNWQQAFVKAFSTLLPLCSGCRGEVVFPGALPCLGGHLLK